ncbi:S41 family peptidase [Proteiniphilum sp.]|uniref:S41 family peptidase n=1 Tax=Proteiniphilum sp. TaxID=1926877 RepID=UPI002B20BEA5|nr:S41 family peptidase [Proteiniphilum sp.]MEA4917329.1 S41 family peptidase [Proteiniphilum sp.]
MKANVILTVIVVSFCVACHNKPGSNGQSLDKKVQNIASFTRLYGYARWFHPSDEAREIDWDKFAVLGIQKVENVKTTVALRDTLYQLFSPIVQGLQIYETQKAEIFDPEILRSPDPKAKPVAWQHYGVYLDNPANIYNSIRTYKNEIDTVIFDRIPPFGEIIKEPIGNNLICVVPLTLLTNDTSTYPQTDRSTLARLQSELDHININGYFFDLQVNLASVIITWNVLQHFFPYFDVIDTDWNEVLGETLNSAFTNKRKKDFFVTLSQMISKVDDGHGIVFEEPIYLLPVRTEFIENKIVITASNDTTLKRGDIILEIDAKPVMEVLDEKEKMISGSPQLRKYRALNILGGKLDQNNTTSISTFEFANNNKENKPESSGTRLLIERDGKAQNIIVANSRDGSIIFNPINEGKYSSETIVEIKPEIYYINMSNCSGKEFEQKKEILARAKAVIYDQRGSSRLNFFQILPYLIKEPATSASWNVPLTIYPDRKKVEFHSSYWTVQPQQPFFKSQSIIINDPSVVSAGETMMGIIDHYNLATTVGELTAGCNGNVNHIILPCGYRVIWTGMKVLKHDGSQLYLKGFYPDYPVNKTIKAIKEGRDEYLEKALEVAR